MPSDRNEELIEPIEFFQYDKIADDVYVMGMNATLKFNVSLSYKNANKERCSFHREFGRRTANNEELITIRRSFDYYLSIENIQKPENCEKAWIRIGPPEYILLSEKLGEVTKWFTDDKYQKLFSIANNKLTLVGPYPEICIENLPMGKYIKIEPAIIEYGNGSQAPGVAMYLSNPNNCIMLNVDKFMGLYYSIKSFNMYQSAQMMLNYVERPEYGFNIVRFDNDNSTGYVPPAPMTKTNTINGRRVKPIGMPSKLE